jgi:hypothetical protein
MVWERVSGETSSGAREQFREGYFVRTAHKYQQHLSDRLSSQRGAPNLQTIEVPLLRLSDATCISVSFREVRRSWGGNDAENFGAHLTALNRLLALAPRKRKV